jgi:alcohol dehydrogenase
VRYFISPKVIFGKGALSRLGGDIQGQGNKAVIVSDRALMKQADQVMQVLHSAGYEVKVWDGVEPEPSLEIVLKGSQTLNDFQPQIIIGLGGGSAIDTAKALWLIY